jgi:hypothetical protein
MSRPSRPATEFTGQPEYLASDLAAGHWSHEMNAGYGNGSAGSGYTKERMRSTARPRRYISRHRLLILTPVLRYSETRDAFVLRGIGSSRGPVLRSDRRGRHQVPFEGVDRRGARAG